MSDKDGLPEMPEGEYVLPYKFAGLDVYRCMAMRQFHGPKGSGRHWQLPCRMTFDTPRNLEEHLAERHHLPIPEWLVAQEAKR